MASILLNSIPPPNLSGLPLKNATKLSILDEAHLPGNSYGTVIKKYHLNYNTLRGYFKKVRRHAFVVPTKGRPEKLDETSLQNIRDYMTAGPWSRKQVCGRIRAECYSTAERRCPGGLPEDFICTLHRVTVYRYANILISELHATSVDADIADVDEQVPYCTAS